MSDRRDFLQRTGAVLAGGLLASRADAAGMAAPPKSARLAQLASNSYPIRTLFKRRTGSREVPGSDAMKQKYGELTLLDFAQFTRDTFPGVKKMDVWSSLFGDVTDASMYIETTVTRDGRSQPVFEFDPSAASSKKWLDQFAAKNAAAGVAVHHVSNNAPRNIADLDETLRREGIATAKKWLDACKQIGARTMRVNTGGPRIIPAATATTGYPRNDEVVKYLKNAISSFKEMADYGGTVGVKVTIENHWGLSADPMNIRIILDELKHPFCEASPDFFNWEHEWHHRSRVRGRSVGRRRGREAADEAGAGGVTRTSTTETQRTRRHTETEFGTVGMRPDAGAHPNAAKPVLRASLCLRVSVIDE